MSTVSVFATSPTLRNSAPGRPQTSPPSLLPVFLVLHTWCQFIGTFYSCPVPLWEHPRMSGWDVHDFDSCVGSHRASLQAGSSWCLWQSPASRILLAAIFWLGLLGIKRAVTHSASSLFALNCLRETIILFDNQTHLSLKSVTIQFSQDKRDLDLFSDRSRFVLTMGMWTTPKDTNVHISNTIAALFINFWKVWHLSHHDMPCQIKRFIMA